MNSNALISIFHVSSHDISVHCVPIPRWQGLWTHHTPLNPRWWWLWRSYSNATSIEPRRFSLCCCTHSPKKCPAFLSPSEIISLQQPFSSCASSLWWFLCMNCTGQIVISPSWLSSMIHKPPWISLNYANGHDMERKTVGKQEFSSHARTSLCGRSELHYFNQWIEIGFEAIGKTSEVS